MRAWSTVLFCLLLVSSPSIADDEKPTPLTPEQAADAVQRSFEAGDAATLKSLAEKDDPDPWLVADELCRHGQHDAAEALAKAAPRNDIETLPAHVASLRAGTGRTGHDLLAQAGALLGSDPAAALQQVEAAGAVGSAVVRVRLLHLRGIALERLGKPDESMRAYDEAAKAALALGWLRRASELRVHAGAVAYRRSAWDPALEAWRASLEVEEAREHRAGVAGALGRIGALHERRGEWTEALACHERALALLDALDDRTGMARTLGSIGVQHMRLGRSAEGMLFLQRSRTLAEELGERVGLSRALSNIANIHVYLGEFAEAREAQEQALAIAEGLGDRRGTAGALAGLGRIHRHLGEPEKALACYKRALPLMQGLRDRDGIATVLLYMGALHKSLGNYADATILFKRSLEHCEAIGDTEGVASALNSLGTVRDAQGKYLEALSLYERALALKQADENEATLAGALGNIGLVHKNLGDYPKALSYFERAVAIQEKSGEKSGLAIGYANTGTVYFALGDYAKSLSYQERALAIQRQIRDTSGIASSLLNIGAVHNVLGDYAKALSYYEQAHTLARTAGAPTVEATALRNIGTLNITLGETEKALSFLRRSLSICEELGDKAGATSTLSSLGTIHHRRGDFEKALAVQQQALALAQSLGDRQGEAAALSQVGAIYHAMGDSERALSVHEQALALRKQLGDRTGTARSLGNVGSALASLGRTKEAFAHLKRAVREAQSLRAAPTLITYLGMLALAHLRNDQPGRALFRAQAAVRELETLLGGLGEEAGSSARAKHAQLFGCGTLAAVRLEEPAEALTFLESGRAGALLESLGGRQALRWTDLPEDLRRAEADAKADESRARIEYGRAVGAGDLRDVRAKASELDVSTERVRSVSARIQREAKRQAGIFYPRAATLEEVQGWLEPNQALVLYGLCLGEALALVLTPDAERIVALGSVSDLTAACEALDGADLDEDAGAALAGLRKLLVEPLVLGEEVTQILVSPEGPLCYVPFGVLFDQPVAMTASGTTHALLMEEEREPGEGVLAVGDPDYTGAGDETRAVWVRGRKLSPLPATRAEAKAIGDVVLLGPEANEETVAAKIAERKRWRAIHFACHGLIDPERPTSSSLALSGSKDSDGHLTAIEVLRQRFPADLAVLSACETGMGQIVSGEGIVGLTRAFMYAGAPRVICSLWKVDDDATQTLMVKFYELWHPGATGKGLPAAEALQQAQAYVRGHEKWRHPFYWAAWVLWGLP